MEKMQVMNLKILLPYEVYTQKNDVLSLSVETTVGSLGILPQRLDCVSIIVPGILSYKTTSGNEVFIAIDEGILVKFGHQLQISVRNAIGGEDLDLLLEAVEREFKNRDEQEESLIKVMAMIESDFMHRLKEFRHV